MAWELASDRPIYTQILEKIQVRIITGVYTPGERLPSVRELAAEASVNPNTMQKAFSELEKSGLILTQRNSGRTVTEDKKLIKQTQTQLALTQINNFIETMKELGYEKDEMIYLLNDVIEGGAKNGNTTRNQ